jgi:hypothetical protein
MSARVTHHDQRADLFGLYSPDQIAAIVQVNRTTAARWKSGQVKMPWSARELLRIVAEGALPPSASSDWARWRFGRDGLLYAPDLKRGFSAMDLRQLHVLQQWHRYMERMRTIRSEPSPSCPIQTSTPQESARSPTPPTT